jgi:hypothetical protein
MRSYSKIIFSHISNNISNFIEIYWCKPFIVYIYIIHSNVHIKKIEEKNPTVLIPTNWCLLLATLCPFIIYYSTLCPIQHLLLSIFCPSIIIFVLFSVYYFGPFVFSLLITIQHISLSMYSTLFSVDLLSHSMFCP